MCPPCGFGAVSGSGGNDTYGSVSAMRISILVVDDVFDTGLTSLLDTFETANELAGERRFEVTTSSPRAHPKTHHGMRIPVAPLPTRTDLVIVPALACKQPETIVAALQ